MNIYDPGGNLFKTFNARWPDSRAVWDGKGLSGQMVESAEDYPVTVKVRDEFGNVGMVKGNVPIDILVFKTNRRLQDPELADLLQAFHGRLP